jgi:hypothetical protein
MPTTNIIDNKQTIRRELGALWTRQGNTGSYLTGKFRLKDIKENFDEVKIIVFPNNKKKSDGSPDFQIFLEKSQYENLTGNTLTSFNKNTPAQNNQDDSPVASVSEVEQSDVI